MDKEKVVAGLRACIVSGSCKTCPYEGAAPLCIRSLMRDALELVEGEEEETNV